MRDEFAALDKATLATIITDSQGNDVMCDCKCQCCVGGEHVMVSRMVDPELDAETCLLIPVYHDECTFIANDGKTVFWMPRWSHSLKKKSRGKGIMASSFVCECHGELRVVVPVSNSQKPRHPSPSLTPPPLPSNSLAESTTTPATSPPPTSLSQASDSPPATRTVIEIPDDDDVDLTSRMIRTRTRTRAQPNAARLTSPL